MCAACQSDSGVTAVVFGAFKVEFLMNYLFNQYTGRRVRTRMTRANAFCTVGGNKRSPSVAPSHAGSPL